MALTNFFVRRPCISIITPYILLIIFTVIAIAGEMFSIGFERDDSNLVNDHKIVIDADIVTYADKHLNRVEAQIDKKREDMLKEQIRYETGGLETILFVYENKSSEVEGLLAKKNIEKIIKLENDVTSWDKPSDSFKNSKFKGTNVKWVDLCFAGEDAPEDPRSETAACLPDF